MPEEITFGTLKKIFDETGLDVHAARSYLEIYSPEQLIQQWEQIKAKQEKEKQKFHEQAQKLREKRDRFETIKNTIKKITPKTGFWTNRPNYNFEKKEYIVPDPEAEDCITPGWSQTPEAKAVLLYMENSKKFCSYNGYSINRITGEFLGGDSDMIGPDGKWIFPEKWEKYITDHDIKPKESNFIQHCTTWQQNQYFAEWVKQWNAHYNLRDIKEMNIEEFTKLLQQEGIHV